MINKIKQYDWKKYNYSLLGVVIILCIISAFTVKLAGGSDSGASYMKSQLIGMVLGLFIVAVLSILDYHFICRFAPIYYLGGILLTAATHTPIGTTNGTDASRWISLAGITFQPTELMKIILILTLSVLFSKLKNRLDRLSTLLLVGAVTGVPVLLILTQPDLSSSLVAIFIMVIMIFVGNVSYKLLSPIFLLGIPLSVVVFWYIQQPNNFLLRGYQYNRIQAWLHPETDVKEVFTYQQNRSVRAIAAGKLSGKFLQDGGTQPRAYEAVGVRESDFIWSVIGEEFGFLGCCLILILLMILIFKCFSVAKRAQDYLGKMIAVGVASMYMFQVFANICVATLLFPNTGLPLPFLSNGLSSMLSSMMGIGLIMNISIQPAKSSKRGFSMRNVYGNNPTRDIDMDLDI